MKHQLGINVLKKPYDEDGQELTGLYEQTASGAAIILTEENHFSPEPNGEKIRKAVLTEIKRRLAMCLQGDIKVNEKREISTDNEKINMKAITKPKDLPKIGRLCFIYSWI